MRIKLTLGPSKLKYNGSTQHYVNSFIHRIIGSNNKYHDAFSEYAVSSLQGGKFIDGYIQFPDGAYFYVSTPNEEFYMKLITSLITCSDEYVSDMKLCKEIDGMHDFSPHNDYDIIRTISPILIKDYDHNVITFKNDNFLDVLLEKSKTKLIKYGLSQKEVDTIKFEPFHFEKAKEKYVKVKKFANKSSQIMLVVRGDKEVRKVLYEMGLGKSTGCGFGSVEIIDKNQK